MKQKQYVLFLIVDMGVFLFVVEKGFFKGIEFNKILDFEVVFYFYMNSEYVDFMKIINELGNYNDEIVFKLNDVLINFKVI